MFDLIEQHKIDPDKVKKVRVALSQPVFDLHGKLAKYKAKFDALISGHYTAAVILHDQELTLDQFEPARYDDPKLRRAAAEQIELRADAALTGVQAVVEIETDDDDTHGPLRASARVGREPAVARPDREQIPHLCRRRADPVRHRGDDRGRRRSGKPGLGAKAHGHAPGRAAARAGRSRNAGRRSAADEVRQRRHWPAIKTLIRLLDPQVAKREQKTGRSAMNRRSLLAALTSAAALAAATGAVAQTADNFPNRPIRIIVPQAAGSGIDLQARTLAQKMGELWGQPGIVENCPGANAIIGTDAVAKAAPDGYTLVYAPVSAVTTNVLIYKNLPYDPLRDFAPITQTVANPLGLIANPVSGPKSIKELVERAKANPGAINYGSFGIGNMTHLQGVLLSLAADIKMTHVPYRGQTPEITDILSGQIPSRLHHHGRRDRTRGIGKAQSAGHVRRGARRAVSQYADADRSRLSASGRGWMGGPARAGRHAKAHRR